MLESILVYTVTAFFLYVFAKSSNGRGGLCGNSTSFWTPEIILSILLFGFIAGARYGVGVDYFSYYEEYQRALNNQPMSRDSFEPGFVFITKSFAYLGLPPFFYYAFWAVLQISFIYYALKDRKFLLPYVALSIMLNTAFFINWMNGIRQCVVSCAFVFLAQFIVDRKPVKYVVGILLLSLIHKSAIILLPLYFLTYSRRSFDKKYLNLGILIVCTILGLVPSWLHLMTNFSDLLMVMGYESYAENMDMMVVEGTRTMAWGPSRLSSYFTGIAIIWYYPKMKEFYKGDRFLTLYFLLFFVGMCLYNAFVNTSHIFLRPVEYFTIFKLPLIAYLFYYLKKSNNQIMFLIVALLMFSQVYIEIYKAIVRPTEASQYTLYKFFFQQ